MHKKPSPSTELLARIRQILYPLSLDARRDVLGAIQLSLDSIVSMPSHTRVRPDASARQSILGIHFELLGLDYSFESLSQVLASLTPRDLSELLEQLRAESRIREILSQLPSKARLGVLIAIQAYFDTIVSLSLDRADASALQSILGVWFPILGLADEHHVLESLSEAACAAFAPHNGANVLESLQAECQAMDNHAETM